MEKLVTVYASTHIS